MRLRTPIATWMCAAVGVFAPASQASAADPIAFTIKFPPGQIDHQTLGFDMDQTVSGSNLAAAKQQKMKVSSKTTLKQIKSDASGSTVEVTYDELKLFGSMLGQAASDNIDKTLAALTGEKITLHFTTEGKVDKVEGIDAIVAKLPAGAGQTAIKQFLDEERLKDQYNSPIAQLLPTKPVNMGDTWETEISHKVSIAEVKIKSQVKLVGIDDRDGHKIAKLEFTAKGSLVAPVAAGGPKLNMDKFDQFGTAEFDLTRGWITSQIVNQQMNGSVQVNLGANPVSMKIEQTIKATTTLTPAKPEPSK